MGWKVFVPDNYLNRIENKLHELAGALSSVPVKSGGWMGGSAGLACFYAYYAEHFNTQHYSELILNQLERSINPDKDEFTSMTFCDGLAGIGWCLDLLYREGLLNIEVSEIFDHIDQPLFDWMLREIKTGHYDYMHGALGPALYFLRESDNPQYRQYLSVLVKALEEESIPQDGGGIKWNSLLDAETGLEGVNLSLSHGMASIIRIIQKIYCSGIEQKLSEKLLRGTIKYMQQQRLNKDTSLSLFPSWALESAGDVDQSRLAWCYGDLGVGLAYFYTGLELRKDPYLLDGMDILQHCSRRMDPAENLVHDAGICHGAAGLALIYNVLYQRTNQRSFMEAALYWLDICMNMALHDDGIAGFKTWHHPDYGGWVSEPGLLEGASGIGLVMMSFLSDREASWCEGLLLK